jgi:hypothetical protein
VHPDGPFLCPDGSVSRVLFAAVSGRFADRLVSEFRIQRVSGQLNFVSGQVHPRVGLCDFTFACLDALLAYSDKPRLKLLDAISSSFLSLSLS